MDMYDQSAADGVLSQSAGRARWAGLIVVLGVAFAVVLVMWIGARGHPSTAKLSESVTQDALTVAGPFQYCPSVDFGIFEDTDCENIVDVYVEANGSPEKVQQTVESRLSKMHAYLQECKSIDTVDAVTQVVAPATQCNVHVKYALYEKEAGNIIFTKAVREYYKPGSGEGTKIEAQFVGNALTTTDAPRR